MLQSIKKFLKDEEGQSMVEYGITLGGIAAVSYIAVVVLGDKTADLYAWMANHLPGGEADEGLAQVRLTADGLVGLDEDGAEYRFAERTSDAATQGTSTLNYTMNATLGGGSAYEAGDGGWNVVTDVNASGIEPGL
ncbi:hypothetical protein JI742_05050 [Piscinibacter sp. Jin2]|uniref:Flp family type IVb pilin n=1 Tax=Aquariibacter lacus TaxID=2801332 RepID=A0A9X1BR67_9BURK|nr:hypothetical protein [Piscinibacter lacus]MBL0719253.1 hypothetical protein [Piscinibacter lacus]